MQDLGDRLRTEPPKKILVMGREHLGDIANTTGGILALRKAFPNAHLAIEVGERTTALLDNFPVDEVLSRPTHQGILGKWRQAKQLRTGRYDLAVIFDDSNVLVMVAKAAAIPIRIGIFKSRHASAFTASAPRNLNGHDMFGVIDDVLALIRLQPEPPKLFPTGKNLSTAARHLKEAGLSQPVLLNLGASRPEKEWPMENWMQVAHEIPRATVIATPENLQQAKSLGIPAIGPLHHPLELAALASLAKAVISADTGPMHIAAVMGTPVVGIFGPTQPARMGPYGPKNESLHAGLPCDLYLGTCAANPGPCDLRCMTAITPQQVLRAVQSINS